MQHRSEIARIVVAHCASQPRVRVYRASADTVMRTRQMLPRKPGANDADDAAERRPKKWSRKLKKETEAELPSGVIWSQNDVRTATGTTDV